MPLSKRVSLFNSTIRYLFILGVCLYLVSFFLPACDTERNSSSPFHGWDCAWMAFDMAFIMLQGNGPTSSDKSAQSVVVALFSFLSGSINLMIPAYLWLSFTLRSPRVRRGLAVALVVSIAATWADFYLLNLVPLIGHFIWIAGILLIIAREFYRETIPSVIPNPTA